MVRRSSRMLGVLGLLPVCRTSDFEIGTQEPTLPDAWSFRVSVRLGWPDASIL